MTDSVLVAALCARSPGALADLYDSYAESVYRYCRSMLATSDAAESALLGTFIAAEAHIHALADSRRLEAWLYALARGECVRRHLAEGRDSLVPAPVFAAGGDADLRVMAWNATRSLSAGDREVLDLSCRHGFGPMDLAAVLGVTPKVAGALYESARERLRDVVTAEVLVRKGPYDCASRARMLTGFTGELTPEARERVIRHVNRCDTCAPHRVRQVSAAKVFDLLPLVALPPTLRAWVMSHFTDPERVPYRRDVARLAGPLDGAGFPAGRGRGSRRPYALAGAAAAVAAVAALALVLAQSVVDPGGPGSGVASGTFPAVAEPDARMPGESRRGGTSAPLEPVGEGTAIERIGSLGMTEPVSATGPVFGHDEPGAPDPAGPRTETSPRRPGDGSSGDGAADPAREGPSADGPADRPAAPAENPAPPLSPLSPLSPVPPVPPVSPVPPGASGIGAPDRHPPSRHHHGHSSRRCGITHRPADPALPRANPGSPQANPRPPRGEHRPPHAVPRPPRADAEPPRANPRPSHADPRRPRTNPGHPRSGPRQVPDDSRPAPAGPGRTSGGAGRGGSPGGQGPERISNGSGHGRTPDGAGRGRTSDGAGRGRTPDGAGQGGSSGGPGRERSSEGSPSASTGTTPATPPSRPESPSPSGTAAIPA
ncbi:sigma factor [Streptosporangium sp. NPDC023963]|uniref:sigma factor n=1 Tax=Streptosporangium sp. NPDC023963 TaxID=3155608 RepID=UPI00342496F7